MEASDVCESPNTETYNSRRGWTIHCDFLFRCFGLPFEPDLSPESALHLNEVTIIVFDAISIRMAGLDDKSEEAKGISLLSDGLDMVWRIRTTNPDRRIQLDQATQPTTDTLNDGWG
ncbi:hypothetical protein BDA99DRAFT_562215 [Phascolomyces articulosus]|uniref:Uncharacterized protein n=1 Tax=Phascolomyces articulosus TaxID=60185 RepID=A0AAD5JV30_9FUNG|nr:hypothetical protein BDA99DRAFT_562215 [Phascolomyces articulosus]